MPLSDEEFTYERWRHGGWYVTNIRYPSGACGCVSRNYPDKKWRIACDSRDDAPTYSSRNAAARAERDLIAALNSEQEKTMIKLTEAEQYEYNRVMEHVQDLEEIGGPEGESYPRVLQALIHELQQRIAAFREHT